MIEEWKPIPGYEGLYSVSDQGRVRAEAKVTLRNGIVQPRKQRMLSPVPLPSGHLKVRLTRDGHVKAFLVHRLVLLAFVGPCPEGMEGCHLDDDPKNNRLSNLRWDTRSANMHDRVRNGRHHNARKTECSQGHPFNEQNTYVSTKGRGCRTCDRERMRAKRAAS